jgi:hypothetical protein
MRDSRSVILVCDNVVISIVQVPKFCFGKVESRRSSFWCIPEAPHSFGTLLAAGTARQASRLLPVRPVRGS